MEEIKQESLDKFIKTMEFRCFKVDLPAKKAKISRTTKGSAI